MKEIISLPSGSARNLVKEGKMKVVSPSPSYHEIGPLIEKAKHILGEDYLGRETMNIMGEQCRKAGINVTFVAITDRFPYLEKDLDQMEKDKNCGRSRLVVLRPNWMVVNGEKLPVSLINLFNLFKDKNPFGDGHIFWRENLWWTGELFAHVPMTPRYAMPTKKVLPDSFMSWYEQEKLFQPGETRRAVTETVWDSILYYAATGTRLLEGVFDWSLTVDHQFASQPVYVGAGSSGMILGTRNPSVAFPTIGVCPQR